MGTPFIYTALSVPTVASLPSADSLQWSGDGQVCLVTRTAIHILAPDPGITFDDSSVTHAPVGDKRPPREKGLGWFRTMIELKKGDAYSWPSLSQDWANVPLGSLDVTFRAAACSPSNLTRDSGCVIATLSSNMDLSLWTAEKNHLKGEWIKTHEVTPSLIEWFSQRDGLSSSAKASLAQTTCIAWSSQPNFGLTPNPLLDGSLLIAGCRAGALNFMRFDGKTAVNLVGSVAVADNWITHLAVSSWSVTGPAICKAYVAYGVADGSVSLVEIVQTLRKSLPASTFGQEYAVETVFQNQGSRLFEADGRGITALAWLELSDKDRILVHCKPGVLKLCSLAPTTLGWSGYRTLFLQTQKLSVGSSALHPVSGVHHLRDQDALILCLFDGSFHVVDNLSSEPIWSPCSSGRSSKNLSTVSRFVFTQAEREEMQYTDVSRISGMLSCDGSATVLWFHEACQPTDFSYKHDAQHTSKFVMVQLWDDTDDEAILQKLTKTLESTQMSHVSIHTLRPFFLYLRRPGALHRIHSRLLDILNPIALDSSLAINFPAFQDKLTKDLRSSFRHSLKRHLFGCNDMLSLRLQLSLADFCWQSYSQDTEKQAECGWVAQLILDAISQRVLRTMMRHLVSIVRVFSENDMFFIARILCQSFLPGTPPDLVEEAKALSTQIDAAIPSASQKLSDDPGERCPACNVPIPLQDVTNAVCSNGHAWSRCSITLFILSTPMVRTCLGCSRKALLPLSSDRPLGSDRWLPAAAHSWIVEELLEAVHRCLFCGNRFVSVL